MAWGSLHFIVRVCGRDRHKELFLSLHIRKCPCVLLVEGCLWGWGLHSCSCKSGSGKRQKSRVFTQYMYLLKYIGCLVILITRFWGFFLSTYHLTSFCVHV